MTGQWNLRVVLIREENLWVAQCLEFDIAAQGATIIEAQSSFVRTFVGQALLDVAAGKRPFADFKPAPDWYVEQFEAALQGELAHKLTLGSPLGALTDESNARLSAVADVRVAA